MNGQDSSPNEVQRFLIRGSQMSIGRARSAAEGNAAMLPDSPTADIPDARRDRHLPGFRTVTPTRPGRRAFLIRTAFVSPANPLDFSFRS